MNLNREKIDKDIICLCTSGNNNAEEILKKLNSALKKAKKTHTKIRLCVYCDEGDQDSLPTDWIALRGTTEETEEEWHKRLEEISRHTSRDIENAKRVLAAEPSLTQRIQEINEALKKSSLKCVDCGCPCTGKISSSVTKDKSIRICYKCHENRKPEKD